MRSLVQAHNFITNYYKLMTQAAINSSSSMTSFYHDGHRYFLELMPYNKSNIFTVRTNDNIVYVRRDVNNTGLSLVAQTAYSIFKLLWEEKFDEPFDKEISVS